MTTWKHTPYLPRRFEVSDDAQVRTLPHENEHVRADGTKYVRRNAGRIIKQRMGKKSPNGVKHLVVGIYRGSSRGDNTNVEHRVAYLVASAFHGLPYDRRDQRAVAKWKIRFRDGDKLNCHASNLEWVFNCGEDGSEGKTQSTYEKNLDGWEAQKQEPLSSRLSRLFGEAA